MPDPSPYQPPRAHLLEAAPEAASRPAPTGIGGWLVLVGLGVVFTPVRVAAFMIGSIVPIFRDDTWEILTTPGSGAYHPLWGPLIGFEVVVNSAFLVVSLAMLVLFFRRAAAFPRVYVAYALIGTGFVVLDAWLTTFVVPDQPIFDADTGRELARSAVAVCIWVPYMLVSKRVANTFVEPTFRQPPGPSSAPAPPTRRAPR